MFARELSIHDELKYLQIFKYYKLIVIVILYYDHLITFSQEVKYFWARPFTWFSAVFYVNRYLSFFVYPVVLYSMFTVMPADVCSLCCTKYSTFYRVLSIIAQIPAGATALLRTWALYNRQTWILVIGLGIGACAAATAAKANAGNVPILNLSSSFGGCFSIRLSTGSSQVALSLSWVGQSLFDTFIFATTLAKTLETRVDGRSRFRFDFKSRFFRVILRDGTVYYFILLISNLCNAIMVLKATPVLTTINATPSNIFTVLLTSRLLLHLRAQSPRYRSADTLNRGLVSTHGNNDGRGPENIFLKSFLEELRARVDDDSETSHHSGGRSVPRLRLRRPLDHTAVSNNYPPPRSPRRYRQHQHQRRDQQLQLQLNYPHRHCSTTSMPTRTILQITTTAALASSSSSSSPAAETPLRTPSKSDYPKSIHMRHLQLDLEQASSSSLPRSPPLRGSASFLHLDSPSLPSADVVEEGFGIREEGEVEVEVERQQEEVTISVLKGKDKAEAAGEEELDIGIAQRNGGH